ncbi:P-loop containing nucleoside triphosphate hydrolase protein [Tricharina praecox]|uniref:P-loop containing nucleoside triphosphate hydrolase protein n=1 Tax=Tricharina praecox TaxID=43433 RepID=UPI002220E36D|nr:P-loop containing nucleoside triphosphate hydrolase protein [Tricharina praecox]KAI5857656.1 P-loop containing nucleoside triphosphate hydrolase protein [Tricharina praecox]
MLRAISSRCPRCLSAATTGPTTSTFVRYIARDAQRKRPQRLILSTGVARGGDGGRGTGGRRGRDDFSPPGLNRTTANIPAHILAKSRQPAREAEDDDRRRSSRSTIDKDGRKHKPKEPREMKHMKMRQSLAPVSRVTRTVAHQKVQSVDSFEDFGLLPATQEAILTSALGDLETVAPTMVQKLVIPALMGKGPTRRRRYADEAAGTESYLIAAETGSGKTLAYAIPAVDAIKRQEAEEKEAARLEEELNPKPPPSPSDIEIPTVEKETLNGRPRVVILVPTSELVSQVGAVMKSLSHVAKFRTVVISREFSATVIRNRLFGGPCDVVVCTPHLLNSLTETNPALFSRCTHVVVDEADSLFDRSFSPTTTAVIGRCQNLQKLILCSATIPRSLDTRLRELYPDMKRLVTPNLHVVPRRVQLHVVDADSTLYHGNKRLACADTLYTIAKDNTEEGFMKKVIVFVNERETTTELTRYLRTKGIDAIEFARDTKDRMHTETMEMFTSGKTDVDSELTGRQRMKVLVTTDIASRGVDTKTVKNVILYDKPHSAIDLIHRIGRTGRMGRRGRAIILVDKYTDKGWIKDIKTSMHIGGPLI